MKKVRVIQLDTEQDLDITSMGDATIGLYPSYFKEPESYFMVESNIPKLLDVAERFKIKIVSLRTDYVDLAPPIRKNASYLRSNRLARYFSNLSTCFIIKARK